MSLREQFTEQLKLSMKAGNSARTSTLRMIMAKLKDTDIAARPKGIDKIPDDEVLTMWRGRLLQWVGIWRPPLAGSSAAPTACNIMS